MLRYKNLKILSFISISLCLSACGSIKHNRKNEGYKSSYSESPRPKVRGFLVGFIH